MEERGTTVSCRLLNHSSTHNVYEYISLLLTERLCKKENDKIDCKLHVFIRSKYMNYIKENFKQVSKNILYERYYDTEQSLFRKQNIWIKIVKIYNENDDPIDTYYSYKVVEKGKEEKDTFSFIKEEKLDFEAYQKREEVKNLLPIATFKTIRTKYQFENVILYVDEVQGLEDDFNYTVCTIEVEDVDHLKSILNWKDKILELYFARSKILKFMTLFEWNVYEELIEKKFIAKGECYQDYDGDFLEEICNVDKLVEELVSCNDSSDDEEEMSFSS
ncbi:hypothetical protein ABK040_004990 [Willaertia magna]